mmetsp:Transcript_53957/g.148816  ORF Transcript_53957/g.148816 Transcript_53957/m.148816 type:complete len:204 (-) Transcript_53957:286-897(-)
MPGLTAEGVPARSSLDNYYCDANYVGGVACYELDTFEANQNVMQVTAHQCEGEPNGYNPSCDRAGVSRSTQKLDIAGVLSRPMCASDECVVDTRRPFRVSQRFVVDASGTLVAIENEVRQVNASFAFSSADPGIGNMTEYLRGMSGAMRDGMVLAFQVWGGRWALTSWLDAWTRDPLLCSPGESCPESSRVVYSDIAIDSLSG